MTLNSTPGSHDSRIDVARTSPGTIAHRSPVLIPRSLWSPRAYIPRSCSFVSVPSRQFVASRTAEDMFSSYSITPGSFTFSRQFSARRVCLSNASSVLSKSECGRFQHWIFTPFEPRASMSPRRPAFLLRFFTSDSRKSCLSPRTIYAERQRRTSAKPCHLGFLAATSWKFQRPRE